MLTFSPRTTRAAATAALAFFALFAGEGLLQRSHPSAEATTGKAIGVPRDVAGMSAPGRMLFPQMANIAMQAGKPFLVADKPAARLYLFSPEGKLLGQTNALCGKARADTLAPAKPIEMMADAEKITPAGIYTLKYSANQGEARPEGFLLAETARECAVVSVHRVYLGIPEEKRAQRLLSDDPGERRITFGCINTSAEFFDGKLAASRAALDGAMIAVIPDASPGSRREIGPVQEGRRDDTGQQERWSG